MIKHMVALMGANDAPAIRLADVGIALGSGGSNRIRSAITQVLVNLLDFGMSPKAAVGAPRIHLEGEKLSFEPGIPEDALADLRAAVPEHHGWPERNLFFGGTHTVAVTSDGRFDGMEVIRVHNALNAFPYEIAGLEIQLYFRRVGDLLYQNDNVHCIDSGCFASLQKIIVPKHSLCGSLVEI